MKLAAVLSVVLFSGLLFGQAPQSYRTLRSTSTNGYSLQSKFFDADPGDRLLVSVSCNFTAYPCLAGPPIYWDGVGAYHPLREIVSLRQLNVPAGTQQQFFTLKVKSLTATQIQVIAPGMMFRANYVLLVQENTSIHTK